MRRSVATVTTLAIAAFAIGVAACEDGPSQTFTPEPQGAGSVINGPGGGALVPAQSMSSSTYTGTATQSFDAGGGGGQNANVLCNATQIEATRKACFDAPVSPPGLAACLDIAGGPTSNGGSGWVNGDNTATYYNPATETWTGATVEQAEAILCQATPYQFFTGLTNSVAWGDAAEVGALYNTSNRQITDILLQTGYEGGLSATSVDGKTTYDIVLNNKPLTKTTSAGTESILLDWNSAAGVTQINVVADAIYDALRAKYSPTTPSDEGCSDPVAECCVDNGHCIIGNNGTGGGYFYYTPLGLAIFVSTTVGSIQANSTFTLIDQQVVKNLPFNNSAVTMKLDSTGEGPVSLSSFSPTPSTTATCRYVIGQTFANFNTNCVDVFPTNTDAGVTNNLIETRKLFGALNHTDETYIFNVVGVDPNFSATLGPQEVISDITTPLIPGEAQEPTSTDTAYALNIDQNFLGVIANDFANNDGSSATATQDWHGIGLVTLETANLVQKYMTSAHGVNTQLGDPDCLANPANPGHNKVCSGLEGILTSAPAASVAGLPATLAVNAVGAAAVTIDQNIGVGLKPSTWYAAFCSDAGGLDGSGKPIGYAACTQDYYFTAFQNAVASSFGPGTVVPSDLADRRFFFQQFILALIKYLHVAADPNVTLATIDAAESNQDDIYFDSNGGGFESGAYVDRTTVNSLGQPPTTLTVGTNLTTSVLNNFSFTRFNTRGERAIYTALTTTPGDKVGAEGQLISNIVGSPVLQSVFGSFACATNTVAQTDNCPCANGTSPVLNDAGAPVTVDGGASGPDGGVPVVNCPVAPLDAFGNPLYAAYAPAFGQSFLNIAANGVAPTASPMTVTATADTSLIQSAIVTVPVWSNPFDPTSANPGKDPTISVLLPYYPEGANTGFPVTIDGSRDKFYNTFNVDFSGVTGAGSGSVSASVDYEYVQLAGGADGGTTNSLVVRAVETTSYLGLVFACAEPNAAGGTDILAVRMYDNANEILDFLAQHPTAVTDCNFQLKYSIYGNYPDYISTLSNGVRFGLNPGFGGSVVSDVTLFDPNVVASLGN